MVIGAGSFWRARTFQNCDKPTTADGPGESLIVARTSEGLGLLASLPTGSGEVRWGRTHFSSGDAERLVPTWAADGTISGDGWEDVAWEQVSAMFGPAAGSTEGPLDE